MSTVSGSPEPTRISVDYAETVLNRTSYKAALDGYLSVVNTPLEVALYPSAPGMRARVELSYMNLEPTSLFTVPTANAEIEIGRHSGKLVTVILQGELSPESLRSATDAGLACVTGSESYVFVYTRTSSLATDVLRSFADEQIGDSGLDSAV